MSIITRTNLPTIESISPRRPLDLQKLTPDTPGKQKEMTVAEKAEIAETKAASAAAVAASKKQIDEIEKQRSVENRDMYLPNISDLSLKVAKGSLGIAQVMMERREDKGLTVYGRYGDQGITNLQDYTTALKDFIGKQETAAAALTGVAMKNSLSGYNVGVDPGEDPSIAASRAPLSNATAAISYRQMQDLASKD